MIGRRALIGAAPIALVGLAIADASAQQSQKPPQGSPGLGDIGTAAGSLVLVCSTYAANNGLSQEQGLQIAIRAVMRSAIGPETGI